MRKISAAVILLLSSSIAQAATFAPDPNDPTTLILRGKIVPGDYSKYVAAKASMTAPIKTVVLASGGGLVEEADRIAADVDMLALATRTLPNSECSSACVLILAAGHGVAIAPASFVGVHQARFANGSVAWESTYLMAAALSRHHVNHAAVLRLLDKAGGSVAPLTDAEMRDSGWSVGEVQTASAAPEVVKPAAPKADQHALLVRALSTGIPAWAEVHIK